MPKTLTTLLAAVALSTLCGAAKAEETPSTVPELRTQVEELKQREPGRYRALAPAVAKLEKKQATADTVWYVSLAAAGGLTSAGVAVAKSKKCDDMPEETEAQLDSKATCLREEANIAAIGIGLGLTTAVVGYVVFELIEPSKKEIRTIAVGQKRKAARSVRVDVGADPGKKSVSARLGFVF